MEKYIDYFSALHTNSQKGVKAPHKAIMLLSVIDLVEYGVITSNQIEFSERLEQQFQHNWSRYVGQSNVFQSRVGTPFWHLNNESFWRLVPYEGGDEAIAVYLQGNPCELFLHPQPLKGVYWGRFVANLVFCFKRSLPYQRCD